MIGFCPLASGSKGNCIYLGTQNSKILIDAGITAKSLEERLSHIQVKLEEIDAILISHEHQDHILGLKTLAFRHGIPVFANYETAQGICDYLGKYPCFKIFSNREEFTHKDLSIFAFNVPHDALDPVAFTICTNKYKIGICTDLGFVTHEVVQSLKGCDFLYIEANHQEERVHACSRPMIYKQRVLGRSGHLSNSACAQLLCKIHHPKLQHIYLAHLSQECNSPQIALSIIENKLIESGFSPSLSVCHQNSPSKVSHFLQEAQEKTIKQMSPIKN